MKKVLVLGSGLVGKTVAMDLVDEFDVTVMDPCEDALAALKYDKVKKIKASAAEPAQLAEAAKDADLVCAVLPSQIEGGVQRQVIEMGKHFVSPSGFLHSDGLDELAKQHNVTAVFDMGIAPGMSNYLVAKGGSMLDELDYGCIFVGGIPAKLDPPFNYRTVFCLEDTMNEYLFPARYCVEGKVVDAPALSGMEEVYFDKLGKLEAFFTDGLRSAAYNVKGKYVAEKTMRWPGYVDAINVMKAAGCFDKDPVEVNGQQVIPFNVTAEKLRDKWKLRPENGDRDLTVMRVIAKGPKDGKYVTYTWDIIDAFDEKQILHSMARTTGYPCAATVRAVVRGMIADKGFLAPEMLVHNDAFYEFLMPELAKRGMKFQMSTLTEER